MPWVGLSRSEVLSDLNLTINMRKNTVGHLGCIFFRNRNIVFFIFVHIFRLYCIVVVLAHKVHNSFDSIGI